MTFEYVIWKPLQHHGWTNQHPAPSRRYVKRMLKRSVLLRQEKGLRIYELPNGNHLYIKLLSEEDV